MVSMARQSFDVEAADNVPSIEFLCEKRGVDPWIYAKKALIPEKRQKMVNFRLES